MENQNMETNTQVTNVEEPQNNEGTQGTQEEKLFTQDDVNRIVKERLARVKNTAAETSEREQELNQREMRLSARERMADLGIDKELLPLVNCANNETLEESINLIANYLGKNPGANRPVYRVEMSSSGNSNGSGYNAHPSDNEIRSAMGLKGK